MNHSTVQSWGLGLLLLVAPSGVASAQATTDSAQLLNRVGRWADAARLGERELSTLNLPNAQRCDVALSIAYARTRLGQTDSARTALAFAERECRATPNHPAATTELAALRREQGRAAAGGGAAMNGLPVRPDDGFWHTLAPEASGLSVAALDAHQRLCQSTGADACLVIYHDAIVQEWYSPRYAVPMMAMSSTKSITALLTALLVADGRIPGLDVAVCKYITTWCDGPRAFVTIRHLLTMTSGLPATPDSSVGYVSDKDRFVIGLTPASPPGTRWAYSNEGAQLLSPILDNAAGEPIQDYAQRRLFAPLGMTSTAMHLDVAGHAWTYADMYTTPRDLGRIGVLMLHHGNWRGTQLLPARWIDTLTTPQPGNPHYGMLWWVDPEARAFAAHGHLDTDIHVVPALGIVVVRMQSKPFAGAHEGDYERQLLPLLQRMVPGVP